MGSLSKSIQVAASPETCFAFIADPEKAPLFIDGLSTIIPININPKGVGNTWKWEYNFHGLPISGESECTIYEENKKYVWESKTGFSSVWTYTFEPSGEETQVSITIDYTPPQNILGKFSESKIDEMNNSAAAAGVENLKTILSE